jgi:hypothetical protein
MLNNFEIKSPGEYAFEELVAQIRAFQDSLPEDMEIGVDAAGGSRILHVESLQIKGQLIVFEGVDDEGHESRLIQHFTQLGVQVIAVRKLDRNARRIGF